MCITATSSRPSSQQPPTGPGAGCIRRSRRRCETALPGEKSRLQENAWTGRHELAGRLAARLSGVGPDPLTWRLLHPELFFCDQIATLDLESRTARITFEASVLDASDRPTLTRLLTLQLS